MAVLTADKPRVYGLGDEQEYPVTAATKIFEGAAVGLDASGNARNAVATDEFVGFASRMADNSGGAAGDIRVKVRKSGLIEIPVVGADATKIGKAVFASDNDTFTLTGATDLPFVGFIERFVSGTTCLVRFGPTIQQTKIADPTGGATVDAEARTAIGSIINALENAGILYPV